MKKIVIVYLAIAVFIIMTIPSISANESNTILNLKKSFSNKTPEQIKEQIKDNLLSKINQSLLIVLLSVFLDAIMFWLITHNHIILGTLILLANLFMILNSMNT